MEKLLIRFENTEHLKDYPNYGVDTEGNVWSFKLKHPKILSSGYKKKGHGYKQVVLTDKNGVKKNFLIHRLVAIAFIPTNDITLEVNHRNRNNSDNRIENLEWSTRDENMKHNEVVKGFTLDHYVLIKLKEAYSASIRKGLQVPDCHSFVNSLIECAVDEYINQYGLRKVMNTLPKP